MNDDLLPWLPPWDDISALDATSLLTPTINEDGIMYPDYSQTSTTSCLSQDVAFSAMPSCIGQKILTKDEWNGHRAEITRLYRDEKKTLNEVMGLMCERYGFRATPKMYKTRISDWDIRRNLRWSEREDACRVIKQKWLTGEHVSKILVRGQARDVSLLRRHMRLSKPSKLSKILLAEAQTVRNTPGDSLRRSHHFTHRNHREPGQTSVQWIMYPADEHRDLEIICIEMSYLCRATEDLTSERVDNQVFNHLKCAKQRVEQNQYQQARLLMTQALDLFQTHLRARPFDTLLEWLRVFLLRNHWEEARPYFDEISRHAYDLSSDPQWTCCDENSYAGYLRKPVTPKWGKGRLQFSLSTNTPAEYGFENYEEFQHDQANFWELEFEDYKHFEIGKYDGICALLYISRLYFQSESTCPNKRHHALEDALEDAYERFWGHSVRSWVNDTLSHRATGLEYTTTAAEIVFEKSRVLRFSQYRLDEAARSMSTPHLGWSNSSPDYED